MGVVRCIGHKFKVRTIPIVVDGEAGVMRAGWICGNCDLKVKTDEAANYLEGKN